ncbi:MAG: PilZ domain-containing protein [Porticoccaceae bacterium]
MPETTTISSAQNIQRELNRLRLARQPFSVSGTALDQRRKYSTHLIEVKPDYLLIDLFIPTTGNDAFSTQEELLLEAEYSGTRYHFFCHYLDHGERHPNLHHRLSAPTSLVRTEHRSDYRLHLRQDIAPNLRITNDSGNTQPAKLENLSLSGAGIRLSGKEKTRLGDSLKCHFHFENHHPVRLNAQVRHLRPIKNLPEIRAGLAFEPLPTGIRRELHHQLMRLQRQSIRTSAIL